MIWIAYLGVAVGLVCYGIALALMSELASDIGNAAMLIVAVALLFRIHARLDVEPPGDR